jgi:hypothetical protein
MLESVGISSGDLYIRIGSNIKGETVEIYILESVAISRGKQWRFIYPDL